MPRDVYIEAIILTNHNAFKFVLFPPLGLELLALSMFRIW